MAVSQLINEDECAAVENKLNCPAISQYSYHASAAVTSVSLEQEDEKRKYSIVPLYHSTVTKLDATVTSVSLEQ